MTYRSLFLFFVLSLFASTAALRADAGKNVNKDAAGLAIKAKNRPLSRFLKTSST